MPKYYITKYALTGGIQEVEAILYPDIGAKTIKTDEPTTRYFHGDDFHETLEAARSQAETMRTKKIASLCKQLERLERMEF